MKHILGIDHLGWLVRDLDAAVASFVRLGFTLSPRQTHSPNMGSANHTFVLGDTYVELIAFTHTTPFNDPWRRRVSEREGLYIASARTDNAAAALDELRAAGFASSDLVTHSRPATLPDGRIVPVAFDVIYMDEEAVAPLHVSICGHRNPEHIFIEQLSRHTNTAVALQEIQVVAGDCAAVAGRCAALFGAIAQRRNGGWTVDAGNLAIDFIEPSQAPAHMSAQAGRDCPSGVCFTVTSLAAAEAVLMRNGVACERSGSRLFVPSTSAGGCAVQFHQRGLA
jgi:catechol 2,3-dioxygenase-like lactoylglutathione lyase family enzyme